MTSTKVKDVAFGKKDGEIFCLKLGLDVRGLSSHNDLHKNKDHKSVLVREKNVQVSPQCHGGFWQDSNISPS